MTGLDALLVALLAVAAYDGWRRGFLVHAADLLVLVPAVWVTIAYSPPLADHLVLERDMNPMRARILAPLLLFAATQAAGLALTWMATRHVPQEVTEARLNHLAGIAPALVKWLALAGIVVAMAAAVPAERARQALTASRLAPPLAGVGRTLAGALGLDLDETVGRAFRQLVGPASGQAGHAPVRLTPITDMGKLRVRPEQEAEMLTLVNAERARAGVPPLTADPALTAVARAHSTDMWQRGYFAHEAPDGADVGDRVRAAHLPFGIVGENIALAPTLETAHSGLMNSPDHRHNILDPRFKRLGVGIVLGGSNGLMVTQNFRD